LERMFEHGSDASKAFVQTVLEITQVSQADCSAWILFGSISSLRCQKSRKQHPEGYHKRSDVIADFKRRLPDGACREHTMKKGEWSGQSLAAIHQKGFWWRQTGSNRRPHACKARALPAELCPRSRKHEACQSIERHLVCACAKRGGPGKT
jgi:hypothetical protein